VPCFYSLLLYTRLLPLSLLHLEYNLCLLCFDLGRQDAGDGANKSLNRHEHNPLLEHTPTNLVMQTPSLNQFGGSPCFAASPLAAPETLLFTPSSRKLLRSMAPNPMDKIPFEMPSGLTPQYTPQRPPPAGSVAKFSSASRVRTGKRGKPGEDVLIDTPVHESDTDVHGKPSATRRLLFGRGGDEDLAAPSDPTCASSMRPPPPPPAFESPLKRLRHRNATSLDSAHKPLFVPAGMDAPGSISLPETPSQDAAARASGAPIQMKSTDGSEPMGAADEALCGLLAGKDAADRGLSDSSTGKSSVVSTVEHMQPSQDSIDTHDKEITCGDSVRRQALAKEQAEPGSLHLKNKLNNILDAMFTF
jgi:hypothetical protein